MCLGETDNKRISFKNGYTQEQLAEILNCQQDNYKELKKMKKKQLFKP